MNDQQRASMQMALGAMLTAQNTLIFKCGGDMRHMERETVDDLVEAITAVQLAMAQPQGEWVDLASAWAEGYESGINDERESEACIGIAGFGAKISPNRQNPYTKNTSPVVPQGEWVDLTDGEILTAANVSQEDIYDLDLLNVLSDVRAIIAKFKEKNTPPVVPQVVTEGNASEVSQETEAEALAEQDKQEPDYVGWYCAHCERGVDGSEVTFHEQHEVCGRVITDDVPPKSVKQEPVAFKFPREPKPENAMGWTVDYGLIRDIAEAIGDQEFHPGYEGIELTLIALERIYAAPVSAKIQADCTLAAVLAEREAIMDEWWMCVDSDLENGVKSLNERAAKKWHEEYPAISGFGEAIRARGEK